MRHDRNILAGCLAGALGLAVALVAAGRRNPVQILPERSSDTIDPHGRLADTPESIPPRGLRDVFWRVFKEISRDRIMLIAAGVAFYLFLAIFPALAAMVSLYGLVADPFTMADHLRMLADVLPPGSFEIVADQVKMLAGRGDIELGVAFFVSIAIALWSTHNGMLAIFDAMNVAYDEDEKRGFIHRNLLGLAFTLWAIAAAAVLVAAIAMLPLILSYVWMDALEERIVLASRWPLLLVFAFCAAMIIHRYGPSRERARMRWLTWGAALTATAWLIMSAGFSFYLGHFADYNGTYGALGAVIGLLMWTWLSAATLIVGAKINAELEHQTAKDTTTGEPLPMGVRGAFMADTLGEKAGSRY